MANTTTTARLHKRFTPLYLACFFQGFVLWYAIEKLFMKSIGFTSETIAVETITFTTVMLILNIPVGILADRWSRKGVLMLASGALILSSLIGGLSRGFWVYVVSGSFWGVFYACYSGCYDSIVYDTLIEETGTADRFEFYYGRTQVFDSVALVLGSLATTVVTHFLDLRAAYFLTIPFTCCAVIALHYFREPTEHKREVAQLIGAHVTATFKAILQKGEVFWIVLTLVLLTIAMRLMLEFNQLWAIALALPLVYFGPVNALLLTSIWLGGGDSCQAEK